MVYSQFAEGVFGPCRCSHRALWVFVYVNVGPGVKRTAVVFLAVEGSRFTSSNSPPQSGVFSQLQGRCFYESRAELWRAALTNLEGGKRWGGEL